MTTSYLFAYYTLDSQVSLSSTNFWYYKLLLCYGKLKNKKRKRKKKLGENKNKLRKMYSNNHEKFKEK